MQKAKGAKKSAEAVVIGAFARHLVALESTSRTMPDIVAGAELFVRTIRQGKRVFTCGNGGSAADSQHLAAELTCRFGKDRRPLPGIALTVDTSALTAIANDYRFEDVFSRQLEALGAPGDLLVAFTTSGTSKNVLAALRSAHAKKMHTVMFTGENGIIFARKAGVDVAIAVPHTETARIQEMHELIYHAWCEYLDAVL